MIAVDTNVLVGILADDPGQPAQVDAARALARQAKRVFVPVVVQVETIWVLESGYGLPKVTLIQVLEHLEVNQAFVLEDETLTRRALELFRGGSADYSDCVILAACAANEKELYTFDKSLGKLAGAALVPTG